ncbi:MAG TPA: DUF2231 domain-containing protein [Burkholderiales bacterium]|nr:DUF2231 domain-containing protein [Burkholderiales bacterium]
MRTPAQIARHPIHPMLVPIPIGCWVLSLGCDAAFVLGAGATHWAIVSFWAMLAGLLGAIAAAVPGIIDMLSLRGTPKKLALTHMALNVTVVVLYAMNFGMRVNGGAIAGLPLAFSVVGITLLIASGWLGGHMVYVHGVAVDVNQAENKQRET